MTELDVHELVPEPPADLLSWTGLERRIRRRRIRRSIAAVAGCTVLTAGIVAGSVAIGNRDPNSPIEVGALHKNGPLLFAQAGASDPNGVDPSQLALVDSNGSQARILTHGAGAIDEASPSPDGRRIAYIRETSTPLGGGSFQAHSAIWLVDSDGSDDHILHACDPGCSGLVWSPAGRLLAFAAKGIDVMDLTGHVQLLCDRTCGTDQAQPQWSPDGKQIVFSEAGYFGEIGPLATPPRPIWVINSDGSDPHKLTDHGCVRAEPTCGVDLWPAWSPDGKQIAFIRLPTSRLGARPQPTQPNGAFLIDANGQDIREILRCTLKLCGSLRGPVWSPDGGKLVVLGGPAGLSATVIDTDGRHWVTLKLPISNATVQAVAWSPNGERIALALDVTRQRPRRVEGAMYVAAASGSNLTRVPVRNVSPYSPLTWLAAP